MSDAKPDPQYYRTPEGCGWSCEGQTTLYETKERAAEAWNRRPQGHSPMTEEMKKAIAHLDLEVDRYKGYADNSGTHYSSFLEVGDLRVLACEAHTWNRRPALARPSSDVVEALKEMLDVTAMVQSGYIPGSQHDAEFEKRLERVRADAHKALVAYDESSSPAPLRMEGVAERVCIKAKQFCEELCEDAEGVPQFQLKELHDALDAWEGNNGRD